MGCQIEIAEKIIEKEGDYCLSLKENRPALHGEVERLFADPEAEGVTTAEETVEKDHGRLEIRRASVCSDIDWLTSDRLTSDRLASDWLASDRRHPGELKFPGLAMIGMVETRARSRYATARCAGGVARLR